jgi:hypothetical protein
MVTLEMRAKPIGVSQALISTLLASFHEYTELPSFTA